jgi:hypothetical protein
MVREVLEKGQIMKWKPFTSGTPYTCKDCPAYMEILEELQNLKKERENNGHLQIQGHQGFGGSNPPSQGNS